MQTQDFSWKTLDGLQMYAKERMPDSAPKASVVLIHGLGEHIGRYKHIAAAFANEGYLVRGFDLRGHGKSEGTRGHADSYDQLALDIDQFIHDVMNAHPGLPVFLYGHSLGGALVLYYGETHQGFLKGIIATSPAFSPTNPPPAIKLSVAKLLSKIAPKLQVNNELDLTGLARDPQVMEKYKADPLVHPLISARLAYELITNGNYILNHAAQIAVPLLLMQGTADRVINPPMTAEFAKHVPTNLITYQSFPGYYHELHNEPEKDRVIQIMIDWFDQHLA